MPAAPLTISTTALAAHHVAAASSAGAAHLEIAVSWAAAAAGLAALAFSPAPRRLAALVRGRLPETGARLLGAFAVVSLGLLCRLLGLAVLGALDLRGAHGHALHAALEGFAFDVCVFGLLFFGVRQTLAAWPRRGWIGLTLVAAALAGFVFLAAPFVLQPSVRGDAAAPAGAGASLLAVARRDGVDPKGLYVFAGRDPAAVDLERVGPFVRLSVSRAALERPTPLTSAALGHLLGHAVNHDLWGFAALVTGLCGALFLMLQRLSAGLQTRAGAPGGASAAVLGPATALALWLFAPAGVAAFNLFDRVVNVRADAHALAVTGSADAVRAWLLSDSPPGDPDPGLLDRVFFYDHPPLGLRLRRLEEAAAGRRRLNPAFASLP